MSFWLDHFASADAALAARFDALTPEACPFEGPGEVLVSAENRVFRFGETIVKFFRPGGWSVAALQEEVDFLEELLAAGVSVVRPLGPPEVWEGLAYVRYEAVRGPFREDVRVLTSEELRQHVHLVARLHEVGARREAVHRSRFDPVELGEGLLGVVEANGYLPAELRGAYADCIARLVDVSANDLPLQRVHADPGFWNVLWTEGGPVLMDLDDFEMAPVISDVRLLWYFDRLTDWPEDLPKDELDALKRRTVVELYREVAPLEDAQIEFAEHVGTWRGVMFDAWFSARWGDPNFARNYPDDDITEPAWWADRIATLTARV